MLNSFSQQTKWTAAGALLGAGLSLAAPAIGLALTGKVAALAAVVFQSIIAPFTLAASSPSLLLTLFFWALGGVAVSQICHNFLQAGAKSRYSQAVFALAASVALISAAVWGLTTGLLFFAMIQMLGKYLIEEIEKGGGFEFGAKQLETRGNDHELSVLSQQNEAKILDAYEKALKEDRGLHILFAGPPGTGKTTIAEHIAEVIPPLGGEKMKVPKVIKVHSSKLPGKDPLYAFERLQTLFIKAAVGGLPICIDEIDTIAHEGADGTYRGVMRVLRDQSCLKGAAGAIPHIIATTNYPDVLDAETREWFDEVIKLDPPNINKAARILRYYLKEYGYEGPLPEADMSGWSGAKIEAYARGVFLTKSSTFFRENFRPSNPQQETPAPRAAYIPIIDERPPRKMRNKALLRQVVSLLAINMEGFVQALARAL